MKTINTTLASFFTAAVLVAAPAICSAESGASEHSGQASKHSALAVSHAGASTADVASAVVSVPLVSAGAVSVVGGSAIVGSGEALIELADDFNEPLVITEKVITVDPAPNKVIVENTTKTTVTKQTTTLER